jgi:hypothetical protein
LTLWNNKWMRNNTYVRVVSSVFNDKIYLLNILVVTLSIVIFKHILFIQFVLETNMLSLINDKIFFKILNLIYDILPIISPINLVDLNFMLLYFIKFFWKLMFKMYSVNFLFSWCYAFIHLKNDLSKDKKLYIFKVDEW